MANDAFERTWVWLHKTFPERQVYIRSDGRVQFFTLGVSLQATIFALMLVFFGWVAFSTVNVVFKDRIIAAKDFRYQLMQASYENKVTELEISYNELNSALVATETRARATVMEMENKQTAIAREVDRSVQPPSKPNASPPRDTLLPEIGLQHEADPGAEEVSDQFVLAQMPNLPKQQYSLFANATTTVGRLIYAAWKGITERRGRSISSQAMARIPALRALEQDTEQLRRLDAGATPLMDRTDDNLMGGVTNVRRIIAGTGIKPEQFIQKIGASEGIGGPEISLENIRLEGISDLRFTQSYLKAEAILAQLSTLSSALSHIPLVVPVNVQGVDLTSGFGPRVDPFTGRYSFHPGVDFAGPMGAPVFATAPGTVIFAGNDGSYGNMVEIDHGYGLHTRYAHLSAVIVRVGAKVAKGITVGRLGSTGRSTGPHVHYEVWYDNIVRDPKHFIVAGR